MNKFAENLKRLLEYRGMSQRKLAKELHTSVTAICRYANGNRTPNVLIAKNIADILQVDINELVR